MTLWHLFNLISFRRRNSISSLISITQCCQLYPSEIYQFLKNKKYHSKFSPNVAIWKQFYQKVEFGVFQKSNFLQKLHFGKTKLVQNCNFGLQKRSKMYILVNQKTSNQPKFKVLFLIIIKNQNCDSFKKDCLYLGQNLQF